MLSKKEIDIICEIFAPYKPKKIGVFGSVARNQDHLKSDIDILYTFKNPISLFTLAKLQILLEEKLNKKVDLVSEQALHPKLRTNIINDLKILYAA